MSQAVVNELISDEANALLDGVKLVVEEALLQLVLQGGMEQVLVRNGAGAGCTKLTKHRRVSRSESG